MVWSDHELEVPVTLYVVAVETGGQVLGAFDGERMVGFTFAVPGIHDGRAYLHSHMTGVLAEARNRGQLKLEGKEYVVHDGEIVHIRHSA